MATIIVDAFGGDNAPVEILKGCALAVDRHDDIEIYLTGDENRIKNAAQENDISLNRMRIFHCEDVISMCDPPVSIKRQHKDSSMAVGCRLLRDGEGDAFVSAGSTGALLVGSTLIVKRIAGIHRCAIAPVMPNMKGIHMLIDAGANVECKPDMLYQFGVMGSVYMHRVMSMDNPRVGLLNIGSEETKGGELQIESLRLLKNSTLNFVGNVEPGDVVNGACDVVVTDGYTGNIFLKLYESMPRGIINLMKDVFYKNSKTKMAAAALKKDLKQSFALFNNDRYGGAPIMGCSKPVFKAHGSSKAEAVYSAITLAKSYKEEGAVDVITQEMSQFPANGEE
ncbi:MAG: phosphate acyltransferase PlsX [Clostridia bacterium]|nr:phosphate acyltransferase PlsX [Clostridia bacterium]